MLTLLCAFTFLALATITHIVWWRVALPQKQTKSLLALYLGILALGCFVMFSYNVLNVMECARVALLVIAFTLAYIISYSAIEADSPTLVMIRAISQRGEDGLPEEQLASYANDEVLIKSRVRDLVRDGHLTQADGRYSITRKGRHFISIFIIQRAIYGLGKGG